MKVPSQRFATIKEHFEKEAAVFDELFFKVVPHYNEMTQTVVDVVPFRREDRLRIIDLGCGTGNLAQKMVAAFPNAQITCVDMAENMLKMAKTKLGGKRNISFWLGDIRDFDYSGKYDIILSSLVLHHIEKRDKPKFYKRLFNALRDGGVFCTIDIFLSSNRHLQELYMKKWKIFMKTSGLQNKKANEMIARHYKEDRPVVFEDELSIMRKAGFNCVDVILKNYNFAVYCGQK